MMDDEYYTDDYMDNAHIPRIKVRDLETIQDIELELATNYDEFYRRIITFILESLENTLPENEPLAILIDTDGREYDMDLSQDGYAKSLEKCMGYFTELEEYETCTLVHNLINIVDDGFGFLPADEQ
tara:strand:+ start:352 stop:732 length:381 start_codon:yes stop_codon:yes gene_type:complete